MEMVQPTLDPSLVGLPTPSLSLMNVVCLDLLVLVDIDQFDGFWCDIILGIFWLSGFYHSLDHLHEKFSYSVQGHVSFLCLIFNQLIVFSLDRNTVSKHAEIHTVMQKSRNAPWIHMKFIQYIFVVFCRKIVMFILRIHTLLDTGHHFGIAIMFQNTTLTEPITFHEKLL